jgi:hypothetical protein
MVYADIQARLHGESVDSVRLETPDSSVPDFMLATVRLDYNGPMPEVLNRLASDIGYRVNEYAMPASGLTWTPHLRASGNKRLIDHLREMNSQVPWHIILDHENRRLVIDYSAEGGMAEQIRSAHEAEASQRSPGRQRQTLPNAESIQTRAYESVQQELSSNPVYQAREAPSNRGAAPAPQTYQASEQWYVVIEGYGDKTTADAMVQWLAEEELVAHVKSAGQNHDVRIQTRNSRDAISVRDHLRSYGVPSSVSVEGESTAYQSSGRPPIEPYEYRDPTVSNTNSSLAKFSTTSATIGDANPASDFSGMSHNQIAQSAMVQAPEERELRQTWRVQLAYGGNLEAFGRLITKVSNAGFDASLHPEAGGYHLRVNGFTTSSLAREGLASLKSIGFQDAYTLAPMRR